MVMTDMANDCRTHVHRQLGTGNRCPDLNFGWHPITALARLAARLLDAELVVCNRPPSLSRKLSAYLSHRRGTEPCLVLCKAPYDLHAWTVLGKRNRLGPMVAWVIDSFWTEQIPALARLGGAYDRFFVTTE